MNRSVIMAVVVALLMTVWMVSGMQDDTPPIRVTDPSAQIRLLMKVKVINSSAQNVQQFVRVQGQVEANRRDRRRVGEGRGEGAGARGGRA